MRLHVRDHDSHRAEVAASAILSQVAVSRPLSYYEGAMLPAAGITNIETMFCSHWISVLMCSRLKIGTAACSPFRARFCQIICKRSTQNDKVDFFLRKAAEFQLSYDRNFHPAIQMLENQHQLHQQGPTDYGSESPIQTPTATQVVIMSLEHRILSNLL